MQIKHAYGNYNLPTLIVVYNSFNVKNPCDVDSEVYVAFPTNNL